MELITRFPDGTEVFAQPAPDASVYEELHDLVHSLVAKALGLPVSGALWRAAHDQPLDCDLIRHEEACVLAIVAYAEAAARTVH